MAQQKKGWVMTKVFHPTKFEKGLFVVDFWNKGTVKTDMNLRRYHIKAKNQEEAIRKAWTKI